jgi:hypothetical protein
MIPVGCILILGARFQDYYSLSDMSWEDSLKPHIRSQKTYDRLELRLWLRRLNHYVGLTIARDLLGDGP